MIRSAHPYESAFPAGPLSPDKPGGTEKPASVYGRTFWLCYAANSLLMIAVSLLFRYADFVTMLGGSELDLGLIVGIGMVGALLTRVVHGIGIDRYGPRQVWLLSLALLVGSLLAHTAIARVDTAAIYLVRIVLTISLAGAFGASITYISLSVPKARIAEIVGMLGSSGFIGIGLGPVLGDWLFNVPEITRLHVDRMFYWAAGLTTLSMICAAVATRGAIRRPQTRKPPILWLLRRYHPGPLLIVAMAMGIGVTLPHTFLRTYTAQLGIADMRTFFIVYAITAFVVRISTRRMPQRLGIRPMILLGLASLAASMLLYLVVDGVWMLAAPAAMAGVAHAFLFPSVVGGGAVSFPGRYRGLATTFILAMFDIGTLIGQPTAGFIIEFAGRWGLPAYGTLFVAMAALLSAVAVFYAAVTGRGAARQRRRALRGSSRSTGSRPLRSEPAAHSPTTGGRA